MHVDLDILDVEVGRANQDAAAGGPTVAQLLDAFDAVLANGPVAAVAVTAYDPRLDVDDSIVEAARAI